MLRVVLHGSEKFDEETNEFVYDDEVVVEMEHSLVSLSKWESIWEKPFFSQDEKSPEEILSYFKCMVLDPDLSPDVWSRLDQRAADEILTYMEKKQTATWFNEIPGQKHSRETITSELLYYLLSAFQIPYTPAETWNLNRLITVLRVANAKNSEPKKMSREEAARQQRALNEARKKKYGTRG